MYIILTRTSSPSLCFLLFGFLGEVFLSLLNQKNNNEYDAAINKTKNVLQLNADKTMFITFSRALLSSGLCREIHLHMFIIARNRYLGGVLGGHLSFKKTYKTHKLSKTFHPMVSWRRLFILSSLANWYNSPLLAY